MYPSVVLDNPSVEWFWPPVIERWGHFLVDEASERLHLLLWNSVRMKEDCPDHLFITPRGCQGSQIPGKLKFLRIEIRNSQLEVKLHHCPWCSKTTQSFHYWFQCLVWNGGDLEVNACVRIVLRNSQIWEGRGRPTLKNIAMTATASLSPIELALRASASEEYMDL